MRLTPEQIESIHQFALQVAGPHASVRLFGSRLDDSARGGDVDLLLDISMPVEQPGHPPKIARTKFDTNWPLILY